MAQPRRVVYTNIGFDPGLHRLLKHVAAEEGTGLASLVREAVALYLRSRRRRAPAYEEDFLFRVGRGWKPKAARPRPPAAWTPIDRHTYGLDKGPHG